MQLDKIYIDEAKRIRKTYLTNLAAIIKKEDEIQLYLEMINNIKKEVEDSELTNDEYYKNKILEIGTNIEKINKFIMPHYEKIRGLDDSRKILYNNIKDKYPTITEDEIQDQIVPHLIPIDQDFTKKNKKLYDKISEKQK
jgi:hypothetical protein